jgi:hypothetical protein
MSDRVKEIKERLEAATPGPWDAKPEPNWDLETQPLWCVVARGELIADTTSQPQNATLIAHAPADLKWALGEIERLRGALGDLASRLAPLPPPPPGALTYESLGRGGVGLLMAEVTRYKAELRALALAALGEEPTP